MDMEVSRMRRHELSDTQWELIEPHIPERTAATGRPARDPRDMLNGMMWVVRTGAPWRDLPERYGPWQTVYDYFTSWRQSGILDQILEALQIRLDADGHIDWDLWCVDGSSIRASRAAAGASKKVAGDTPKSPQTTHWVARAADSGANSTWSLTVRACRSLSKSAPDKSTNRHALSRS